jgi:hypothetical protein
MPVRNTAAYRRKPLAQPSAAASASSCGVSIRMAERRPWLSREQPVRLALAQEGLHAFAPFVAGADVGDAFDRAAHQPGVISCPATSCTSFLQAFTASGPGAPAPARSRHLGVELLGFTTSCTKPMRSASAALKRSAVRK